MKQFILLWIMATALTIEPNAQEIKPQPALPRQDYLLKSKKQLTAGWLLLGGGAVFITTGIIIPLGEYHSSGDFITDLFGGGRYENDGIKSTFYSLGSGAILGSVPCFLAAGRNKRNAARISLINERVLVPRALSLTQRSLPSVRFAIEL